MLNWEEGYMETSGVRVTYSLRLVGRVGPSVTEKHRHVTHDIHYSL